MASDDDHVRKTKGPNSCEWTADAVACLLDAYGIRYALGRGYLRNKDWEEVVHAVNLRCEGLKFPKTMKQCRDKVDSLKKRYKMEKKKLVETGFLSSSWPFFPKLDEILSSAPRHSKAEENFMAPLPRQAIVRNGSDVKPSTMQADEDSADSSDETLDESDSLPPENEAGSASREYVNRDSPTAKGKNLAENSESLSEDGLNTPNSRQKAVLKGLKKHASLDDGSCQRKVQELSEITGRLLARRKRMKNLHPMQALADAIVGFSDVYARIELAKMEIYTKVQLEIAKHEMKRKTKKRKSESSTSSDSESG